MLSAIAPDPDLWVSSNKGHLPFIAFARRGGKLRACGLWEASSNLVSRLRRDSGAAISLHVFRSLMAAFLSCRVR